MELKLKLNLNAQAWNRFQVGVEFTKDEIEKFSFQYSTPTTWNIGDIFQAAKKNLTHDFQVFQKWVRNTCIYTRYVVSEIWRDKNFMYVIFIESSPVVLGLTHAYNANVSAALPKPTVTTVLTAEKVQNKKTKHLEKKLKIAKAKEKAIVKSVRKEHTELMKELGIEVQPVKKKVNKTEEKVLVMECRKPFEVVKELPTYALPKNIEGSKVPKGFAKDIFFTEPQFEKLVTVIYQKFKKYEDEYRINPIVETGRVTYESFQRTEKIIDGKTIYGWKMSDLAYASGNHSGIKCFNPKTQSFVIKYDDGVDAINSSGDSRFILFQRNNLYDFDNWMLYQVSHVLANKAYYNPLKRDYKNIVSYAFEFKKYATKEEYCKTLVSRARFVNQILFKNKLV